MLRNLYCSNVECYMRGDPKYTAGALHETILQILPRNENLKIHGPRRPTVVAYESIQNSSRTMTLMIKSCSDWRGHLANYRDWMA